jgi:hypothetical protein
MVMASGVISSSDLVAPLNGTQFLLVEASSMATRLLSFQKEIPSLIIVSTLQRNRDYKVLTLTLIQIVPTMKMLVV